MLDENKKIGIGLMGLGFGFISLGVVLFFDASLIAIGNVLFLVGLCFCIGIKGAWAIFTRWVAQLPRPTRVAQKRGLHNISNDDILPQSSLLPTTHTTAHAGETGCAAQSACCWAWCWC